MQIPKYFTLKELTATSTGIPNAPETWEDFCNILDTAINLDNIRAAFGLPIRVTSGYRSAAVNKAVGGSTTSAHCKGMAIDIQPYKNTPENMKNLAVLLRGAIERFHIDQLIIYTPDGKDTVNIKWIHVGFSPAPRGQLLFKKG